MCDSVVSRYANDGHADDEYANDAGHEPRRVGPNKEISGQFQVYLAKGRKKGVLTPKKGFVGTMNKILLLTLSFDHLSHLVKPAAVGQMQSGASAPP